MKFILIYISFFSALLWFPVESNAQYKLSDFEGRWRWISGTGDRDTLILVLERIPGKEKLTGYHSFSHNGTVLENSIPETPNRTYDSATIYAEITVKGELGYVIEDHPRQSAYFGKIELLGNNKNTALFYTTWTERPHIFFGPAPPIPPGRTFPDNLILTRIISKE